MNKNSKGEYYSTANFNFDNSLCRFRQINEQSLEAFSNDKLYFSIPAKSFNDPYDTLIYANPIVIMGRIYNNIKYGMDDYIERLKKRDVKMAAYAELLNRSPKKGDLIEEFLSKYDTLINRIQTDVRKNARVICFSERYDSMLMWSHYADQHKGFALVFDKESLELSDPYTLEDEVIKKKPLLMRVSYVDNQVDLTDDIEAHLKNHSIRAESGLVPPEDTLTQAKLRLMLTEKSTEWSYEKEWRIIPRYISLEHESNLGYIKITPKAVILGSKCNAENSKQISIICNKKRIPLYSMKVNTWEPGFKLHINRYGRDE